MSDEAQGQCNAHSGICQNIIHINNDIDEFKRQAHENKNYCDTKFSEAIQETKSLRIELTDKIEEGFTKLEDFISDYKKNIKDRRILIMSTLVSPTIVGIILLLFQYFFK